jgi:hypothetical protein
MPLKSGTWLSILEGIYCHHVPCPTWSWNQRSSETLGQCTSVTSQNTTCLRSWFYIYTHAHTRTHTHTHTHIYIYIGPVAQSVQRLATGWTVRGTNPGGGEIFCTCPDRPWGPPSLLYNEYRVFPGGRKQPERDADPSSLLVPRSKNRVELPKGLRGL